MKHETQTRCYEVRAADKPLTLTGVAVVFNQPADLGSIKEVIAPDALRGLDLNDIVLITNHDGGQIPLARSPKTLSLTVTEQGLEMSAELPDTEQARAVYEAVKRGDLSQMSFAFDIGAADYDEQTQTRTITQISKVYEISIVNYAAYTQTHVEARKAQEEEKAMFNPITASLEKGSTATDTHNTPEYRTAFYKTLMGKELTDAESRAYEAAQAEKRADAFNTLSSSAAVVPTTTLNEVVKQARGVNGLFDEIRLFSVPNNLSVPVGTPGDAASWHTEGAAVERKDVTTAAVTFTGRELIKVMSMSAAVKRMDISAFERYITDELKASIADAIGAAIVSGTGSGQPTGILSGVTWNNKNRIQTASLTADNLLSAIALLPAGYAAGAKFAMSTATLFGTVYPLKDGDGRYFFTDPERGGVRRLFGFEIVLDDNIPAGTILFGNFRYYGVNIPQGVAVEVSRESGFTSGLIDYRALCIADGKPIVPGAFVKVEVQAAG
ncbi:phage major capsid protein [Chordicoccus furentiruminis]|uniref:phage major capsid protein n=1 Tax=Chordicoccus furentiruminis TaxID=2709410 RepID=UPI0023A8A6DA|nr:phage major capsid protein [Chordicoccus furentiruminis]